MPAKSQSQQQAAALALAAKRGDKPVSELKGAALGMYKSMSAKKLEHYAETERKGKPKHVKKGK